MELSTLINVDNTIGWRLAMPDSIIKEALDSVEDNLEDAETTAESLSGKKITFPGYLSLLGSS